MKKAIFIWQISPIFSPKGTLGASGGIAKIWARRFCTKLEAAIKEMNLDCQIMLDDTNADVYEIIKKIMISGFWHRENKRDFIFPKK